MKNGARNCTRRSRRIRGATRWRGSQDSQGPTYHKHIAQVLAFSRIYIAETYCVCFYVYLCMYVYIYIYIYIYIS